MNLRVPKLLALARDQACVNCGAEDGTVVSAHSNWHSHGKGKSIKAHDIFVAHLCFRCHAWLDQGSGLDPTDVWDDTDKRAAFNEWMHKTWLRLWQQRKVRVA